MIYDQPSVSAPIDQGDLIDQCPLVRISALDPDPRQPHVNVDWRRIVVLTQTCDLANAKTVDANVAEVFDAKLLVERGMVKASEIKGPIRGARVWGWYFLPACADLGLGEMLVDLRRLHTIELRFLRSLCYKVNALVGCGHPIANISPSTLPIPSAASDCRSLTKPCESQLPTDR